MNSLRLPMSVNFMRGYSPRGAFTLIEMMVMMSIFTAASMTSLSILNHLAKVTKKTTSHNLMIGEVQRLSEQLRNEVHRCQTAEVESNGSKLSLAFADGSRSEFVLRDVGVVFQSRPAENPGNAAEEKPTINDLFMIEPDPSWQFSSDESDGMVSLLLRSASVARSSWQIDAAVSLDERKGVDSDDEQ
jgi:hypothetical protein